MDSLARYVYIGLWKRSQPMATDCVIIPCMNLAADSEVDISSAQTASVNHIRSDEIYEN